MILYLDWHLLSQLWDIFCYGFKFLFIYLTCILCAPHGAGAHRNQNRPLDSLAPELQMVVSCLWVLGIEPWSFVRAINIPLTSIVNLFFKNVFYAFVNTLFSFLYPCYYQQAWSFYSATCNLEFSLIPSYRHPCLIVPVLSPCSEAPLFC